MAPFAINQGVYGLVPPAHFARWIPDAPITVGVCTRRHQRYPQCTGTADRGGGHMGTTRVIRLSTIVLGIVALLTAGLAIGLSAQPAQPVAVQIDNDDIGGV